MSLTSDFAQEMSVTVVRVTANSFTGKDGKVIEYTDAIVISESGEIYTIRSTKGDVDSYVPGETRTVKVSPAGKFSKVLVPVLRVARDN